MRVWFIYIGFTKIYVDKGSLSAKGTTTTFCQVDAGVADFLCGSVLHSSKVKLKSTTAFCSFTDFESFI